MQVNGLAQHPPVFNLLQADKADYASHAKLSGLLRITGEELPDTPLYYDLHNMARTCHTSPPRTDAVRSAIVHAGEERVVTSTCNER